MKFSKLQIPKFILLSILFAFIPAIANLLDSANMELRVIKSVEIKNGNVPLQKNYQAKLAISDTTLRILKDVKKEKDVEYNFDKIIVTAFRKKTTSQSTSLAKFDKIDLTSTPGTGNDLNRVLTLNPGVVSSTGTQFNNSIYVRGGASSENVYVIDGIELDNANHFSSIGQSGGSLGFVNVSCLKSVDFYSGGFPVSMPSRLSSIIDLTIKNGDAQKKISNLDLSMSGVGLTLQGPISNSMTYLSNIRFVDARIFKPFLRSNGIPVFGDGLLKLNWNLNSHNMISSTLIGALDRYKEDLNPSNIKIASGNLLRINQTGGILKWTFTNSWLKNDISLGRSQRIEMYEDFALNDSDLNMSIKKNYNISEFNRTGILRDSLVLPSDTMFRELEFYTNRELFKFVDSRSQIFLKNDLIIDVNKRTHLSFGISFSNLKFSMFQKNAWSLESNYEFFLADKKMQIPVVNNKPYEADSTLNIIQYACYSELIKQINNLKVILGLRSDYYSTISDYGLSPRLGLRYEHNSSTALSFNVGQYYQFPSSFTNLISNVLSFSPYDYMYSNVPIHEIHLERNRQIVAGLEHKFCKEQMLLIESYYKYYDRQYPYIQPNVLRYYKISNDTIHWLLNKQDGQKKVYGIELQIKNSNLSKLHYVASYNLFSSKNQYTNGMWYTDANDIRTNFGLILGYSFYKTQTISLRFNAQLGRPFTNIVYSSPSMIPQYDSTNGYFAERLKPLYNGSIRYTLNISKGKQNFSGYIEVWNILNQQLIVERQMTWQFRYHDYKNLGILPTAGMIVNF